MRRGREWELRLEKWHALYRSRGVHVVHCNPEASVIDGRLVYTDEGPPDFMGSYKGIPVCFDAKDTERPKFSFSSLKGHQAWHLEEWYKAGGLAFLAIRSPAAANVVFWDEIRDDYNAWAGARLFGAPRPKVSSINMADHPAMNTMGWLDLLDRYASTHDRYSRGRRI